MGPQTLPRLAVVLALLGALVIVGSAPSARSQPRAEILVGFEPGVSASAQREVLARFGAAGEERYASIRGFLASVPGRRSGSIIAALERDPRVRYAEPNVRFYADQTPDDPSFGLLWGLDNSGQVVAGTAGTPDADIDAPEAWSVSTGSTDVTVGVIDTGVDYNHPDLADNIWINPGEDCAGCRSDGVDNDGNGYVDDWHGWDFLNDDNDPFDDNGHGTHVAGTVGAVGNNATGVAGVSWSVRIMPLKFLGANGAGDAAGAVRAVLYASSMGAVVTNNSWGGDGHSQALADAVANADVRGSLFVAAAGNNFSDNDSSANYPSNYDSPNVIAVAATTNRDARAWFSNYGRTTVDLGAPGASIFSTWPGGSYRYLDGTSMAAPSVTGAVALAKSAFPGATGAGLKALLLRTVDPNASLATRVTTGGRLNAGNALACMDAPQVWLEAPAPGFAVEVGRPLTVRLLAGACGDPAGAEVSVTANGSPVALTSRGDGLYTGSFTPTEAGALTVDATASTPTATDAVSVAGAATTVYPIVPGGPAVAVSSAGDTVRLAFDGTAGQRVSLKLTDVTIGTSGCCSAKISILNPAGSALTGPTYFGTSGGFVDTKTLGATGTYTILLDPQSTATGGATVTLYDVPPDSTGLVVAGGEPATATATVPGQNARLAFDGLAGQRISLKLTDVTIGSSGSSSAKISILKPGGTTLVGPSAFGTNGGFVDVRTLPAAGTYTIVVDPQSNAVGSATVTLYDVPPDATASIVPGGAPVSVATTVPGQDAVLSFDGVAGRRVSLRLTSVSIGSSGSASAKVSIVRPDGTTLVSPTYFGTNGGYVDVKTLPVTGIYTIELDPQSNATGGATVTLYDVPPDAVGSVAVGGAATTVSLGVPGQNARLTFSGSAGQRVTLRLTGVTIGTSCCSSAQVSVLNPSGTTLLSPTYFGTSGKTLALTLAATGTYTVVIDPQSSATGSVTAALTSP
ncbi:MAG: S8 family peptidase [Gaiellaceae bacterium]